MTPEEKELKPCPLCCGSNVKIYVFGHHDGIHCFDCGLTLNKRMFQSNESLIEKWNHRASMEDKS